MLSSNYYGHAFNVNDGGSTVYGNHMMQDTFNDGATSRNDYIYIFAFDGSFMVPLDINSPYSIAAVLDSSFGYFQFVHYDYATLLHTTYTYGNLNPTSLTVTQVEAVPLPAAFPLLTAGVDAMGFMGWRKRRKTA